MADVINITDFKKKTETVREEKEALAREIVQPYLPESSTKWFLEKYSPHYPDVGYIPARMKADLASVINQQLLDIAENLVDNKMDNAAVIVRNGLIGPEDL